MTDQQIERLFKLVFDWQPTEFNHGDCVGADFQAANVVLDAWPEAFFHAWPSTVTHKRANGYADEWHDPMPPLERNKIMVNRCDRLVACPGERREVLRSGTWSTVRYAKRIGRPVMIIFPDGTTEEC